MLVLFGTKNMNFIRCKFSIIIKIIDAVTAPSNDAIWDEINEQHQHQSIKKAPYLMPNNHFLVQMNCRFNVHFNWVGGQQIASST